MIASAATGDNVQGTAEAASRPVFLSSDAIGIPGLHLHTEFVTEAEEVALLAAVHDAEWVSVAKRLVCHFGVEFDYVVRPCPTATFVPNRVSAHVLHCLGDGQVVPSARAHT